MKNYESIKELAKANGIKTDVMNKRLNSGFECRKVFESKVYKSIDAMVQANGVSAEKMKQRMKTNKTIKSVLTV